MSLHRRVHWCDTLGAILLLLCAATTNWCSFVFHWRVPLVPYLCVCMCFPNPLQNLSSATIIACSQPFDIQDTGRATISHGEPFVPPSPADSQARRVSLGSEGAGGGGASPSSASRDVGDRGVGQNALEEAANLAAQKALERLLASGMFVPKGQGSPSETVSGYFVRVATKIFVFHMPCRYVCTRFRVEPTGSLCQSRARAVNYGPAESISKCVSRGPRIGLSAAG